MIEATDTEEKAETTVGHGGHDQLPTKIIPWLSQKVNSKCPIKRTESLTKAKLVAHGTSPKTGGKPSLRGLSCSRSCSPTSTPSVYHLAARKGGAGRPRRAAMRDNPPIGTTAGAKAQAQHKPTVTPAGGATRPISAGRSPRAPPAGWSGAGEQAREGRPRAAPGAPRKGEHTEPQSGRTSGTGGAEEGDRTGSPTERRPARGASQRGGRAPPAERAGRAKPRATSGARTAARHAGEPGRSAQKAEGGRATGAAARDEATPGAGPHTAVGAGTPAAHCGAGARAGRRRGPHGDAPSRPRGPPARRAPCAFRAHCRPGRADNSPPIRRRVAPAGATTSPGLGAVPYT